MIHSEAVNKWLKQLRSDGAEKYTGALESFHEPNARCCLGHACHALIPEDKSICGDIVYYGPEATLLPPYVSSFLKITDSGTFEKAVSLEKLKEIVPELVIDVSVFLSLADVNDKT